MFLFRCSLPKAMSISRSEILRKKRKSGGDRKLKSALSKGFRICWLGTSLGVKFSGETRTQSVLWMLIAITIAEEIQGLGGSENFELLNFLGLKARSFSDF